MDNYLYTWAADTILYEYKLIGKNDFISFQEKTTKANEGFKNLLHDSDFSFNHVVFLVHSSYQQYAAPLKERFEVEEKISCTVINMDFSHEGESIHDIYEIYHKVKEVMNNYTSGDIKHYYYYNSGTTEMRLTWLLIAHTEAEGTVVRSTVTGIRTISFPEEVLFHIKDNATGLVLAQTFYDQDTGLLSQNEKMQHILVQAEKYAAYSYPVLITGESGTGKELCARFIHNHSRFAMGPFISVNCGAIPEDLLESELFGYKKGAFTGADKNKQGKIEAAYGGTLFLDEIGEMSMKMQVKLLRFLQEGTIQPVGSIQEIKVQNVRVVAATNQDMVKLVIEGRFRNDLFHRIHVGVLNLPALRQRGDDVWIIATQLVERINDECEKMFSQNNIKYSKKYLSKNTKKILYEYHWPGNIRELENTLKRVIMDMEINNVEISENMIKNKLLFPGYDKDVSPNIVKMGIEEKPTSEDNEDIFRAISAIDIQAFFERTPLSFDEIINRIKILIILLLKKRNPEITQEKLASLLKKEGNSYISRLLNTNRQIVEELRHFIM